MNKTSVKVIKRKDVQVKPKARTQSRSNAKQIAPVSEEAIERHLRRQMIGTISNWISECRETITLKKSRQFANFWQQTVKQESMDRHR